MHAIMQESESDFGPNAAFASFNSDYASGIWVVEGSSEGGGLMGGAGLSLESVIDYPDNVTYVWSGSGQVSPAFGRSRFGFALEFGTTSNDLQHKTLR